MKILIVQGCPKSGTTILWKILNSHPKIELTFEKDLNKINLKKLNKGISNNQEIIYYGDKLPKYYHTQIYKRIKDLKIIHISRNPINTINSMMVKSKNAKKEVDNSWNTYFNLKDHISE
jgi:UDP-galactopyranose mutase